MRSTVSRSIWLVAVAFLAAAPAGAQTLEEALALAYSNNPRLRAERQRVRAVDEQVPQALANWRPKVTVTGDLGINHVSTFVGKTSQADYFEEGRTPRSANLNVTQPLFRGGRTLAQTKQAESNIEAARAQLQVTEQTVFMDGITAYMDVVRNASIVQLRLNNEQVLRSQLQAARDRFRVGEITRTDVFQAEARLARATANRILAEGTLANSRATFRSVFGELPGTLRQPAPPGGLPASRAESDAAAMTQNPSVVLAQFTEQSARANVDLVTGELLPTFNAIGDVTKSLSASSQYSASQTAQVRGSLSVPLYETGSVWARSREARETASQRRIEVERARRDAVETSGRSWSTLESARASIEAFATQVRANEIALEGVRQEAQVGSRTTLDTLDAEQELLDAQVNLVGAQRDEIVASYQVAQAIGRLTAEALKLPVTLYDPKAHASEVRYKWIGFGDPPPE